MQREQHQQLLHSHHRLRLTPCYFSLFDEVEFASDHAILQRRFGNLVLRQANLIAIIYLRSRWSNSVLLSWHTLLGSEPPSEW